MLNKLLKILILLALSAQAAATTISFEDEGTTIITTPGSVVNLNIITDGPLDFLYVIASVEGDVSITDAIGIADAASYGWDPSLSFDPIITANIAEIGMGNFAGNNGPIVAYVEITYGSGTVVVSGYAPPPPGYWPAIYPPPYPVFSTGVVTIVPEPATLLLLALGCLALRGKQ